MTGRTGGTSSGGCDLWLPYKTAETLQDPQNVAEDFARVERWASHISRGDCLLPKSWCGTIASALSLTTYAETPISITGPHSSLLLGMVTVVVANQTGAAGLADIRGYFTTDGASLNDHPSIIFTHTLDDQDTVTLSAQCVFAAGATVGYDLVQQSGIDCYVDSVRLTLLEVNSQTGACCTASGGA